jgi:15-cis-phytoene synthase
VSDWISYEALLIEGYRRCAKLTWRYGTTYFWGAAVLPKSQRKHVYAIYALCRLADDTVDHPSGQHPSHSESEEMRSEPVEGRERGTPTSSAATSDGGIPTEPNPTIPDPQSPEPVQGRGSGASTGSAHMLVSDRLNAFAESFRSSLAAGDSTDPVMAAVIHTVISCGIDPECLDRFFSARAMDLTTTSYETWEDLCIYMEGSAAVIGEMMLPVLKPISQTAMAPARSLGLAFQLTNFLRDVDEDLDRGRVYLPQDDLRIFDVDLERREATPQWRAFMAYEIERNRALYSFADTGIAMLPPRSARCVGTARVLYAQILDQIELNGYDVFSGRAQVPTLVKAATAARMMVTGPRTLKKRAEAYQRRSMADVTQDTY